MSVVHLEGFGWCLEGVWLVFGTGGFLAPICLKFADAVMDTVSHKKSVDMNLFQTFASEVNTLKFELSQSLTSVKTYNFL